MLTDKLNTRRENKSGTLLEDEWSDLVRDETLLEHLGFFARVSMHEMSQMFWIHGSGVISSQRLTASKGRMRQMKRAKLNLNLSHTLTQSEHAFGIIHRIRMFILVSLFQKILAVKVFCLKRGN